MDEQIAAELAALASRLGRLPTSTEALGAVRHNRTKVHAAWRAMIDAAAQAERRAQQQLALRVEEQAQALAQLQKSQQSAALADRQTVQTLADRVSAQAEVITSVSAPSGDSWIPTSPSATWVHCPRTYRPICKPACSAP